MSTKNSCGHALEMLIREIVAIGALCAGTTKVNDGGFTEWGYLQWLVTIPPYPAGPKPWLPPSGSGYKAMLYFDGNPMADFGDRRFPSKKALLRAGRRRVAEYCRDGDFKFLTERNRTNQRR